MIADDWALIVARRDRPIVPLDTRDADLVAARAELERERARRVEAEGRLARFDVATERRLELEAARA